MYDFLKANAVALVIAMAGFGSTYAINTALYGYRISALEEQVQKDDNAIDSMRDNNVSTQLAILGIQKDIEYIKLQLGKLVN
jgi:hypothetical protein